MNVEHGPEPHPSLGRQSPHRLLQGVELLEGDVGNQQTAEEEEGIDAEETVPDHPEQETNGPLEQWSE